MSVVNASIGAKVSGWQEADVRFKVGRDALGEAVAFVARALPSRPVIPVLSAILLDAGPDGLILSCFDYEVSARVQVDADIIEPGTALVPGRLLAEITRSLPARPAEFSEDAGVVNLTCGSAHFELVCLPVQDYPPLPESPDPVGTVDSGTLLAAVAQVAPAASRDDTLPMLTAVCLDISGPVMTLVATDRYRLAAREVSFTPAARDLRAIALVPARIMVEASRTMAAGLPVAVAFRADGDRPAEGLVSLEAGGRRLTARLIAGEFIRYQARFPADFGCCAELPAGPLIEAVRRAALVAERAGPVRLSFTPGKVVIEAHAEGRARAAETVSADFTGEQTVISFNPHFLLDGLTAAEGLARSPEVVAAAAAASDEAAAGAAAAIVAEAGVDAETGGGAEAGGGRAAGEAARAREDAAIGRIRLEFTSPAKPALITWVGDEGLAADEDGGESRGPAFRYLLVPLRAPVRT